MAFTHVEFKFRRCNNNKWRHCCAQGHLSSNSDQHILKLMLKLNKIYHVYAHLEGPLLQSNLWNQPLANCRYYNKHAGGITDNCTSFSHFYRCWTYYKPCMRYLSLVHNCLRASNRLRPLHKFRDQLHSDRAPRRYSRHLRVNSNKKSALCKSSFPRQCKLQSHCQVRSI